MTEERQKDTRHTRAGHNAAQRTKNRNKRRKRRRNKKIAELLRTCVLLAVVVLVWRGVLIFTEHFHIVKDGKEQPVAAERNIEGDAKERVVPFDEPTGEATAQAEDGNGLSEEECQEAQRIYQANPEILVLVNKEMELPQSYDAQLRKICDGRLKASARLYDDLTKLLQDGKRAGYQFWIASAYRSRQRQQGLVNEDVRKYIRQGMGEEAALEKTLRETMPAGHSEHETGLALDILSSDNLNMDTSQEQSKANGWLRQHCHEYGFILRYPKEDEGITGIAYEPWHFRYVGKEAAAFITEHQITLEEFCEAVGIY